MHDYAEEPSVPPGSNPAHQVQPDLEFAGALVAGHTVRPVVNGESPAGACHLADVLRPRARGGREGGERDDRCDRDACYGQAADSAF